MSSPRYQSSIVTISCFACLFSLVYVATRTTAPQQVHQMVTKVFKVVSQDENDVTTVNKGSIYVAPELVVTNGQDQLNLLRKEGVAFNLAGSDIDKMSERELNLTIHSYLDNTNTICWRKLRMGKLDDGGWEVCDDPEVRPVPPCTIYSFGINNDFSFDDDVSRLYGCHVYAFDPSMGKQTHNRSNLVHFYNWGIGGKTEFIKDRKWQMYTYKDLREKLGHSGKTIDLVKMDIEGSEWSTINDMLSTGQFKGVKQFLVEYHVHGESKRRFRLKQVQGVEMQGYRKFMVHKNIYCPKYVPYFPVIRTACYEVHYKKV